MTALFHNHTKSHVTAGCLEVFPECHARIDDAESVVMEVLQQVMVRYEASWVNDQDGRLVVEITKQRDDQGAA